MENIRSYESQSIEFPRGITLFEGDIGSGKSTVLMGIEFALFGLGSTKAENLLAKKAKEGSVTLRFQVDDQVYEIKRILKRRRTLVSQDARNSYLKIGDELLPLSPSELKQKVLQILKFNEPESPQATSRIFRYAVFTPQEEMKTILQRKDIRLETIRRAFRVEDYRIASNNASDLVSEIRSSMSLFRGRFENFDQINSEFQESKNQVKQTEYEIKKLETDEARLEKDENAKKDGLEKSRVKQQDKIKLGGKYEKISSDIEGKKNLLQNYKETIEKNKKKLEEIKEKLNDLKKIKNPTSKKMVQIQKEIGDFGKINDSVIGTRSEIHSIQSQLENLESKLGGYKGRKVEAIQKLEALESTSKKHQAKSDELKNSRDEIYSSKIKLEKEVEDLTQSVENVKGLGPKCRYCGHELTSEHLREQESERVEKLKDTEKRLEKISAKHDEINSAISKSDVNHSDAKNEADKLKGIIPNLEEYDRYNSRLEKLKIDLEELEVKNKIPEEKTFPNDSSYDGPVSYLLALKDALLEYENSGKQILELGKRQEQADDEIKRSQTQIKEAQTKISELQKELGSITKKLEAYENIDQEQSQKESELDGIQEELRGIRDEIASNNANLGNQKTDIERLSYEIQQADKWKKQYEKFENYSDWLRDFFIPTISQIEKQVLLSIQQIFNEIYQRWYAILIDDPTKESYIDEEFTPIIVQDGYDQDVKYLSGGEKTSIALAYRLTLNSMMRRETDSLKSNLLILDEPTDGFSKTQLSKAKYLLDELHSQQIILVSHEKELEAYVENVFHVSKDAGISHVTRLSN